MTIAKQGRRPISRPAGSFPNLGIIFHNSIIKQVLHYFKQINGNFKGVWGNHDKSPEIKSVLKRKEIIQINGKRLGLIHGVFSVPPLRPVRSLYYNRLLSNFENDNVDMILYGHTHKAESFYINDILLFNPGTLVGEFPSRSGCSYGIVKVGKSIDGKIYQLADSHDYEHGLMRNLKNNVGNRMATQFMSII